MKPHQKTAGLVLVAALLAGLNFVDTGSADRLSDRLPVLSSVEREAARRIELSTATHKIVLEAVTEVTQAGELAVWHLVAPIEGDADQMAVRSLLNQFRKDVPLDAKVDAGNLDQYGLDAGNGLVVEIFEGSDSEPTVSFTVGKDAPGGSSFIRLSGDDAIYRARIGGRHRYDKAPADWRNRVLMGFQASEATALQVQRGGETTLALTRLPGAPALDGGSAAPGTWALDPDPGWPTDQELATRLVKTLGTMRAGELLGRDFAGGFDPPLATITVVVEDGTTRGLEIGSRSAFDGAAFVRRTDGPEVFKASSAPLLAALQPAAAYRERTLFSLSRGDVDTMRWEQGRDRVLIQQDLANGMWRVIEPTNVDLDLRPVFYMVNTFVELRADDVADDLSWAAAGLDNPQALLTARMLSGAEHTLRIGRATQTDQGLTQWYVGTDASNQVFVLSDKQMQKLRQGFGRG